MLPLPIVFPSHYFFHCLCFCWDTDSIAQCSEISTCTQTPSEASGSKCCRDFELRASYARHVRCYLSTIPASIPPPIFSVCDQGLNPGSHTYKDEFATSELHPWLLHYPFVIEPHTESHWFIQIAFCFLLYTLSSYCVCGVFRWLYYLFLFTFLFLGPRSAVLRTYSGSALSGHMWWDLRTIWGARDPTWVSCIESKCPACRAITQSHLYSY